MSVITKIDIQTLARSWRDRVAGLANAFTASSLPAQRVIRQLREAGALTPATARPFRAQSTIEEAEFLRLLHIGIIREPVRGCYS
jgi:hypothetical protein